jgi:hypothetical protein
LVVTDRAHEVLVLGIAKRAGRDVTIKQLSSEVQARRDQAAGARRWAHEVSRGLERRHLLRLAEDLDEQGVRLEAQTIRWTGLGSPELNS